MRCAYYCCGEAYSLHDIEKFYRNKSYGTRLYEPETLHVMLRTSDGEYDVDVFIFEYGCITFWGVDSGFEMDVIDALKPFLLGAFEEPIVDSCSYKVSGEDTTIDEENDTINLESDNAYLKLSLSYGLSQSSKLISFERSVARRIDSSKDMPYEIIKTGKVSLSRKALSKKIGELFAERNSINLHSMILDTPEFFWRRPKYQPYYEMAAEFMDLRPRIEVLNKKLDIIHELYDILSNELKYAHTSRLELIITLLILIEVLIAIFREFF